MRLCRGGVCIKIKNKHGLIFRLHRICWKVHSSSMCSRLIGALLMGQLPIGLLQLFRSWLCPPLPRDVSGGEKLCLLSVPVSVYCICWMGGGGVILHGWMNKCHTRNQEAKMTLLTVLKLLPGSPKEDTSYDIGMSASPDILYSQCIVYRP
jgi:hypothetical protein